MRENRIITLSLLPYFMMTLSVHICRLPVGLVPITRLCYNASRLECASEFHYATIDFSLSNV